MKLIIMKNMGMITAMTIMTSMSMIMIITMAKKEMDIIMEI